MKKKLIILDRDGVINFDSDNYIKNLNEFIFIPGSIETIANLSKAGYLIAVATNQSGVYRQFYDLETLEVMHQKLKNAVVEQGGKIDKIEFCPHGPDDNCTCRKPLPGMLESLLNTFNLKVNEAIMVGDSIRDIEAAMAINMESVFVKTGKGERSLAKIAQLPPNKSKPFESIPIFDTLETFGKHILKH